jgi:uncharacterized repeat protein (TIGR02543 family)
MQSNVCSTSKLKTTIAVLIAALALAIFAALPAKAQAAEVMAYSLDNSGNRTNYYSTDAALTAGYTCGTIYLACDWNFTGTMEIADSKTITIDMNGHKITSQGNGSVIRMREHSTLELKCDKSYDFGYYGFTEGSKVWSRISTGGLVTGGYQSTTWNKWVNNGKQGGGIWMDSHSYLILNNVTVGGNNGEDAGGIATGTGCRIDMQNNAKIEHNTGYKAGGIMTNSNTTINMDHSTIMYNYSCTDGGGLSQASDSLRLNMKNESHISSNVAKKSGGGIYLGKSWFNIESDDTCSVGYNATKDRASEYYGGAGIYVDERNTGTNEGVIKGLTIIGNNSFCAGGGIFLGQKWTKIYNCRIINNKAARAGGGVYDNAYNNYIADCEITGNTCSYDYSGSDSYEGGGVFVSSYYTLNLTGVCTIKNNARGDGTVNDVFLSNFLSCTDWALLSCQLLEGSSVGVRMGITGNARIAKDTPNYVVGTVFMDNEDYYVTHGSDRDGDLWQRKGTDGFLAKVNGKGSTRYAWKSTITANGASSDKTKHFWYWDIDNSTGLSSVDTDALKASMYNEQLSYSMPQNDTDLKAEYTDYITKAFFSVIKPVAGQQLPRSGQFAYTRGDSSEILGSTSVEVEWYEVAADGTRTPATGYAKHSTKYEAVVAVDKNTEKGVFYSTDYLPAENVTVRADNVTVGTAASTSVSEADGSLSFTTCAFTTGAAEVKAVQPESLAITSGYTKADIADMLPDYANVTLSDGSTLLLATDKNNIECDSNMFDADGKSIEPTSDTADFTAKLHLAETDQAADAQDSYVEVTITIAKGGVLAAPNVEPVSATYNNCDTNPTLDENLQLKVTASSANKDEKAKIMYTIEGDSTEYAYDASTGVVLTGKANDKASYNLTFWVQSENATGTVYSSETEASYTLDDTMNKAITVNCADTAYYADGVEPWTSSFTVTGTLDTDVDIVAPDQDGRVFDHWEWAEAPEGLNLNEKELTITNYSLDYTGKITAVYSPVINKIDLGVTAPAAHSALDAAASYVKFGFGSGEATYDATELFKTDGAAAISWSPVAQADGTAAHLSNYVATLTLNDDERFDDCSYALADPVTIYLNGQDITSAAYMGADASGCMTLSVQFPNTGAYEYESLGNLEDVELSFSEASAIWAAQSAGNDVDWSLPKAVLCNFKCDDDAALLDIDWDEVTGFKTDTTQAQELTATGTVKYSEDIDNEGASPTVSVNIKVAAPEKVAMPKACMESGADEPAPAELDADEPAPAESGTYDGPITVYLGCETDDATIYYTVDGSDPVVPAEGAETTTYLYSGDPIAIGYDTTLKVIAVSDGMLSSDVATYEYTIKMPAVAAPAASVASSVYSATQTIALSCATEDAIIYYTTDGTQPDEDSAKYDGTPITVSDTTTIKAFAGKDGMTDSATTSFTYVIQREQAAKPQASLEPGTYSTPQTMKLSCATEGAVIHYTIDGSEPNEQSPVYSDTNPIEIGSNLVVKARAYSADAASKMLPSDVATFTYKYSSIVFFTVTFDSNGGSTITPSSVEVKEGDCVNRVSDPVRDGYYFEGWFTEDGEGFDFDTPITENVTLIAKWTEIPMPGPDPDPDPDPQPQPDPTPTPDPSGDGDGGSTDGGTTPDGSGSNSGSNGTANAGVSGAASIAATGDATPIVLVALASLFACAAFALAALKLRRNR